MAIKKVEKKYKGYTIKVETDPVKSKRTITVYNLGGRIVAEMGSNLKVSQPSIIKHIKKQIDLNEIQ